MVVYTQAMQTNYSKGALFLKDNAPIHKSDLVFCCSHCICGMRGSRKFFSAGANFDNVFLDDEWIQIPLKSGHHWPASGTPSKWRFASVLMMAQY